MSCISSGNPNSMIYLPLQDESKYSSKGEMPVQGGKVVKAVNLLKQIYVRKHAPPALTGQSGCHSVPPWLDRILGICRPQRYLWAPPSQHYPNGCLKTRFLSPQTGKQGSLCQKDQRKNNGERKERLQSSPSNNHELKSFKMQHKLPLGTENETANKD